MALMLSDGSDTLALSLSILSNFVTFVVTIEASKK